MKTIDEPMPICEAEMERLEDQLVEDCKSLGMAESIRDFLQEPFSEWMDDAGRMNRREMTNSRQNADCPETVREHLPSPAADHGGA